MFKNFSLDSSLEMDLGGEMSQPSTFGFLKIKEEPENDGPAEPETLPPLQEADLDIKTGRDLLMGDEINPAVKSEIENYAMEVEGVETGAQVAISRVFTMRVNCEQRSPRNSRNSHPNFKRPKKPITKDNLGLHPNIYKGVKLFTCKLCNYRTFKISNFKAHKASHLPTKRTYRKRKGFYTNPAEEKDEEWDLHKETKNMKEKVYKCRECDYQASREDLLHAHKRTHVGEKPYVCHLCSYRSRWKGNLKKHMSAHEEGQRFADSRKDSHSNNDSYTEKHMEIHTEGKNDQQDVQENLYMCEVCGYRTSWKRNWAKHMRTHTPGEPLICDDCDYQTSREADLIIHRRTHRSEKPYKCDDCDYRTTQKTFLLAHERVHTGEKPFKCNVCGYRTGWKANLKKHINIHHSADNLCDILWTPKKTYKREIADRKHDSLACNDSTLDENTPLHTENKPFACDSCDYKSSYKWRLKLHKEKCHSRPIHDMVDGSTGPVEPHLDQPILPLHEEMDQLIEVPHEDTDKRASNKLTLAENTQLHTKIKIFACDSCEYKSKYKWNLKLHKKNCHSQPIHDMVDGSTGPVEPHLDQPILPLHEEMDQLIEVPHEDTDKRASNNSSSAENTQLHTKNKVFACDSCEYKSKYKWNLKLHKKKHHSQMVHDTLDGLTGPVEPHLDQPILPLHEEMDQLIQPSHENCDKRANNNLTLAKNAQLHTKNKVFTCDSCEYKSKYKWNLKLHKKKHHSQIVHDTLDGLTGPVEPHLDQPILPLHEEMDQIIQPSHGNCDKRANNNLTLAKNAQLHTKNKVFTCDSCEYKSKYKWNLKLHKKKHHSQIVHDTLDGLTGPVEPHLDQPIQPLHDEMDQLIEVTHEDKDNQACYDSSSAENAELHEENKVFACDSCEYKSKYKWNLKLHKKKHHSQVVHDTLDGLTGPVEPHLDQPILPLHEEMDQLIQPSHENSDKRANNNLTLAKNAQLHTKNKVFTCDSCEYKSKYKWNLKLHKKKRHSQIVHDTLDGLTGPVEPHLDQPIQPLHDEMDQLIEVTHEDKDNQASYNSSSAENAELHEENKVFACDSCEYKSKYEWNLKVHKRKHSEPVHDTMGRLAGPVEPHVDQPIQPLHDEMDQLIEVTHEDKDNQASYNSSSAENAELHEENKVFACDSCEYKSKYEWNLKVHKRKHSEPVHDTVGRLAGPVEPHLDQPILPLHDEMDQLIELPHGNRDKRASNNSTLSENAQLHTENEPFANLKLHKNTYHSQPVHFKLDQFIESANKNTESGAGTSSQQQCSVCFKAESKVSKFRCENCRWFWVYWKLEASEPPDCPGHVTEGENVFCPRCRWVRYKIASQEWEERQAKIRNAEDLDLDDIEPRLGKIGRHGSGRRKISCTYGPISLHLNQPILPQHEEMDQLIELAYEDKDNKAYNNSAVYDDTLFDTENKSFACDLCSYRSEFKWDVKVHKRNHRVQLVDGKMVQLTKSDHEILEPSAETSKLKTCSVCFKSQSKVYKSRCMACRAFWSYRNRAGKPPDCPGHTMEGEDVDCPGCRWGRYKTILLAEQSKKKVEDPDQPKDQDVGDFTGPASDKITPKKEPIETGLVQPILPFQHDMDIKIEPASETLHEDVANPAGNHPICPICLKSEAQVFKFRCEDCKLFWNRMVMGLAKPPECPGHGSAGEDDVSCPGCRRRRYEIAVINAYPGEPLRVPPMTQVGQELMDRLNAGRSYAIFEDGVSIKEEEE